MEHNVNPHIIELIKLGNEYPGGTRLTFPGCTREDIKERLRKALDEAKQRMKIIKEKEKMSEHLDQNFLEEMGWLPITDQQKNGELYFLIVISEDHPTEDNFYHRTIGFNTLQDTGEDVWLTAGWSWSYDEFTHNQALEGVLYYQEIPPMFREKQNES